MAILSFFCSQEEPAIDTSTELGFGKCVSDCEKSYPRYALKMALFGLLNALRDPRPSCQKTIIRPSKSVFYSNLDVWESRQNVDSRHAETIAFFHGHRPFKRSTGAWVRGFWPPFKENYFPSLEAGAVFGCGPPKKAKTTFFDVVD
jgi:hypothetical protein